LDPELNTIEDLSMSLFRAYMKITDGNDDAAWALVKKTLEKTNEGK
jgi:hypothetical protein